MITDAELIEQTERMIALTREHWPGEVLAVVANPSAERRAIIENVALGCGLVVVYWTGAPERYAYCGTLASVGDCIAEAAGE